MRSVHRATRSYKEACEEIRRGQICPVAFGLGEKCCKRLPKQDACGTFGCAIE